VLILVTIIGRLALPWLLLFAFGIGCLAGDHASGDQQRDRETLGRRQ